MLQRLDRLTLDEARTTAAQTLEVVYGLVNNLTEVMNGEWIQHTLPYSLTEHLPSRWASVDSRHTEGSRSVFFFGEKPALHLTGS